MCFFEETKAVGIIGAFSDLGINDIKAVGKICTFW